MNAKLLHDNEDSPTRDGDLDIETANSVHRNATQEEVAITLDNTPGEGSIQDAVASGPKTTVFFSYSNKDRDWVEDAINKLESGGKITCLYDDRDFIAGVPIVDNILSCIMKADRTVLVLSPDFVNSPWCRYEVQLTLSEHLARERKVVIPVLLRDNVIPDFVSHLTYLDVQDARFWEKFMDLLLSDCPTSPDGVLCSQRFYTTREEDQFNGKVLLVSQSPRPCRWSERDVDDLFEKLNTKGIQVEHEARQKVKKAMRETGYIRCLCGSVCCYSIITKTCLCTLFLPVSIIFLVSIVEAGKAITPDEKFEYGIYVFIAIIFAILPWMIWIGCSIQFVFVFFNSRRCLACVEELLRSRAIKSRNTTSTRSRRNVNSGLEELESLTGDIDQQSAFNKEARRYMAETAGSYAVNQCNNRIGFSIRGQRHAPHGACLCQMVEKRLS
ncbi:uncharacterized protein [Ptychodera flava]|uniref:uncharacterized protein isoform X2 n=1 Tax=Ptychodera flava TaxID=63121 RepID=UPI00396A0389